MYGLADKPRVRGVFSAKKKNALENIPNAVVNSAPFKQFFNNFGFGDGGGIF
jgi:hypothetical protein